MFASLRDFLFGRKKATSDTLVIAAIDFGTTFSGWAFAFKHESDQLKIRAKNWSGDRYISPKTPTTVLIKPDGKTLEAFGFEAEDKYVALCAEKKHKDYYYFSRFKMMLHDKLDFHTDFFLEGPYGKRLPAKDVFKHAIRFLKDDLQQECSKGFIGSLKESEVIWVLTVPAIWNEMAKQFMRDAAEEAGIPSFALKIALEPEAASLFCRTMALEKKTKVDSKFGTFEKGTKYIVLDAGGGTVDIAVHEILDKANLRELHIASGGAWGGITVDGGFEQILTEIFSQDVLTIFRNENMYDYIDLFRTFELKKREISREKDKDTIICLPLSLVKTYKKEKGSSFEIAVQCSKVSDSVKAIKGNKLRIESSLMKQLFSTVVENITRHISELLNIKALAEVNTVIMVGGLSESSYLPESVMQAFPGLNVVVPPEASLAVLKGAVIFGDKPTAVIERKVRFTYGIEIYVPFKEGIHPEEKFCEHNDERYCAGVFENVVEAGRSVKLNERIKLSRSVSPVSPESFRVSFYGSSEMCPSYVTDSSCFLVGNFVVKFDESKPKNLKKEFFVSCFFGETEIKVEAEDVTTKTIHRSLFKLNDL